MKYLIDAAAALALFAMLLMVFVVDHFVISRVAGPGANTLPVHVTESGNNQR